MSLVYNYLGMHNNPTTALRLVVKADANVVLSALVNGVVYTGDTINTTVRNGIGKVDITGLSPNTTYDIIIRLAGVDVKTVYGKTLPTDSVKIAFASCLSNAAFQSWASYIQRHVIPDVVYLAGDLYYENNPSTNRNQQPVVDCTSNCLDIDNRYTFIQNFFTLPEVQSLFDSGVQFLYMYDDHEIFNSWEWDTSHFGTMSGIEDSPTLTAPLTVDELLSVWRAHKPYLDAIHYGNPDSPSVTGDIPTGASGATGVIAGDFTPLYYSVGVDTLWSLYALDVQSHRSNLYDADSGTQDPIVKTCLGANQRGWLFTQGAADNANHKLIMTGKYVWELANEGTIGTGEWDRWNIYPSERQAIIDDVNSNWSKNVTLIAGDVHQPIVAKQNDLYCFCICPAGIENIKRDAPYGTYTSHIYGDTFGANYKFIGVIDIDSTGMRISLHDLMRRRAYKPYTFDSTGFAPIARQAVQYT